MVTLEGPWWATGGRVRRRAVDVSGSVRVLATLESGPDRHNYRFNDDADAAAWVGASGLGGIALNADGAELYVANLYDGRVYRLSVPDGGVIGSFAHGASGLPWRRNARLFTLGFRAG